MKYTKPVKTTTNYFDKKEVGMLTLDEANYKDYFRIGDSYFYATTITRQELVLREFAPKSEPIVKAKKVEFVPED